MRPDVIRHHEGPMMDLSFNPFPPGGRNGSWHDRGEIPHLIQLNRFPTFVPIPLTDICVIEAILFFLFLMTFMDRSNQIGSFNLYTNVPYKYFVLENKNRSHC